MIIGKRTYQDGSSSSVKIKIWRTETEVHCQFINGPLNYCFKSTKKFSSEKTIMNMKVKIPEYTS